ncbi:MAG: hypothetical protein QOF89_3720 [Acidobacteriota bacterium]|jgi:amino acid adenylation domain-containing protein|nr:hypothetical protein [Acidobacteriota bacterium]
MAKSVEALYPLSPQQLGMLLESLHGSESGVHVEQHAFPLDAGVDLDFYRAAWQRLVDRHPSLRTAFVWKDASEPLQAVLAGVKLPFEQRDLPQLEEFLTEDRRRGFDMARPPLMRLTVFHRTGAAPTVVWTHHHILLDGWSLPVLVRELGEIYRALVRGEEPGLPPVRPYRDYVSWLGRQDGARAEAFWREALAGITTPTPLGREDGSIGIAVGVSSDYETVLARPWAEKLQQTALQHRLTLNTLVQGVWGLLLSRYSGEADVVFGTTVSGRPSDLSGVESMIGLFINTIPFRLSVPERADLWDWLRQLQQRHSDLRQYEHCSTGQIHSWSGLPGSLPLYESVLVFENYPLTGGDRDGEAGDGQFSGARTKYPLTLLMSTGPELTVRLVHDPRRLPAASAERIAGHLLRLLRVLAEGDVRSTADLAARIAEEEIPRVRPRHASPAFSPGPRTATEERLAEIWRELLGVDSVGIADDFFAFGGHSLLATRLVSRVRETLQVDVSLRRFFDAPTLAGLAAMIDDLQGQVSPVPGAEVAPRPPDADPIPLSFAQQRLWFLQQLDPASLVYNVPAAIWFRVPLRPDVLERTLHEIVRRHEVLRTRFELRDGQPCQVIDPETRAPLPLVDLSALPSGSASRQAREIAREEARRRFDLGRGPLLRALLLRLGPAEHALLLTLHHIVCDGWSMTVLERELAEIHRAFAAGEPSPLSPLPVQYADFALWQRHWLQGEVLASHLAYWRGQLANPPPFLTLPTDFPRPAAWSFRGAGQQRTLSQELTAELKALSRREGCTLFMTLLAALEILLFRWTGQGDVLVGTPIAGRNRGNTEGLIGFFINTLVLRTRVAPDLTLRQLLARVRDTALGAYAHQDLPFERLLEELQPERSLGRNPLFQVFFNMLTYDGPAQAEASLADDGPPEEALAKFDLTFYLEEVDRRLQVRVVYSTDLFGHDRVREMLRQYEHLLDQVASRPDEIVSRYSLVTPAARRLLPDPAAPLAAGEEPPLHELFLQAARQYPGQPAVVGRRETWTYAELEAESGLLAALLQARGIERGDVVAIHGDRSASLVLALLGVLRAGAAFLLLDPAHPAPRLVACLRQARPRGWIELAAPPPALGDFLATLPLKIDLPLPGQEPAEPLPVDASADDLAYVAFTSGTTGEPRGILGSHAPVSHFLSWHGRTFDLRPSDRFGMLSGVSHDPLLRDVLTPLSLGATLCVPDPQDFDTPGGLAHYIRDQGVTVLHLTPALGRLLADSAFPLPSLRYLFFGGDMLREGLLQALRAQAPNATFVNFYGTTETPQAMGCHVVEGLRSGPDGRIPIGRGIDGCQLLIETAPGIQAGIGEPGEVHVRSPYLCKGFLKDGTDRSDRTDQTDEAIGGAVSSDRFRTGDLGRYLPDGSVVLAGRADDQLKIRGFRVEPSEVEAALEIHPAVRQAAVVAREGPSGEDRLVAFVVGETGQEVTVVELQQFVRTALPEPMVPSHVVFAERLPLTANGKVDRRALPAVDGAGQPEPCHVPPRNDVERTLARIWSDVLGLERVGATDHFFGLGGHSLLAVRMLSLLRNAFQVELPLRTIFEAPTVAALAEAVERAREHGGALLPAIGRISRERHRIELKPSD